MKPGGFLHLPGPWPPGLRRGASERDGSLVVLSACLMEEAALLETHTSGGGGSGTDTAPRSSFQSSSSPSPGGLCCDHGTREKPQRLPEPASKEPARSSEARPRRWPRGAEMELGVPGWELRHSPPHSTPAPAAQLPTAPGWRRTAL